MAGEVPGLGARSVDRILAARRAQLRPPAVPDVYPAIADFMEMLAAERETLISLRNTGRINDEVLSRTLHDLDLEEAILSR